MEREESEPVHAAGIGTRLLTHRHESKPRSCSCGQIFCTEDDDGHHISCIGSTVSEASFQVTGVLLEQAHDHTSGLDGGIRGAEQS